MLKGRMRTSEVVSPCLLNICVSQFLLARAVKRVVELLTCNELIAGGEASVLCLLRDSGITTYEAHLHSKHKGYTISLIVSVCYHLIVFLFYYLWCFIIEISVYFQCYSFYNCSLCLRGPFARMQNSRHGDHGLNLHRDY